MARSKHTIPPRLRAPTRVRDPFGRRGVVDRRTSAAAVRAARERGWVPPPADRSERTTTAAPLPRIRLTVPRPGYCHPIGPAEIADLLSDLGEAFTYGLREVVLARQPDLAWPGCRFGLLLVPGRVVLYEQPCPPWIIGGSLTARDMARLRRAGATVERLPGGMRTRVDWPDDTLRDFFLFDVLTHEVGHHQIQQYRAKRTVRAMRTRDHEAVANRFAQRCREHWSTRIATRTDLSLPVDRPPDTSGPRVTAAG